MNKNTETKYSKPLESTAEDFYKSGKEHLAELLAELDLRLHLRVLQRRRHAADRNHPGEAFRGLYVPHEEIENILRLERGKKSKYSRMKEDNKEVALEKHIRQLRRRREKKTEKSLKTSVFLPFFQLALLFRLDRFELDLLLICMAPEVDQNYEKIYAYLQDDVTKKYPTVNFILELQELQYPIEPFSKTDARSYFLPGSPLLFHGLIQLIEEPVARPLLSKSLRVNERIVNYLLGINVPETESLPIANYKLIEPEAYWTVLEVPAELKSQFVSLASAKAIDGERLVFYLEGAYGAGRKTIAEAFCHQLKMPLLVVNLRDIILRAENDPLRFELQVKSFFREALLLPAALYVEDFDLLFAGEWGADRDGSHDRLGAHGEVKRRYYLRTVMQAVENYTHVTFLAGEISWPPMLIFKGPTFIKKILPKLSYKNRKQLWKNEFENPKLDIDGISGKFKFTPGQIKDAAMEAICNAASRSGKVKRNTSVISDDLYIACRNQSNRKLSEMARKIEPHYGWNDIILPRDQLLQLKEIRDYIKNRHKVYDDWEFGRKLSLGKGLNILFTGPSGTGKTMSAEVIAKELGLDLYRIDLSCVVSKYIGETEKNLASIFKEAETANSILFFDEADALFGKRSEVKDSHDRYANIEIGYLLQKMEEYEGAVILATNLKNNMDEAFVRRMHCTVEFPFPDESSRRRIWDNIYPPQVPLSETIDFDFLSKNIKISGGIIKNIAVTAAFYAAEADRPVNMKHLVLASKREFQKIGKLCLKSDFLQYYDLVCDTEI
jgi:ATP-dependent 26S proteasome regulatory subunit